MVPTEQEEVSRVFDLVSKKQADDFEGEFAPIHIVPQKQIVGIRGIFPMVKKSE